MERVLEQVLSHYQETCQPARIIELEHFDGFSTRTCYKVTSKEEEFFGLRCWKFDPVNRQQHIDHLQFTQAVFWTLDCEGSYWLPLPFETDSHQGYVEFEGETWELLPWFTGRKIPLGQPFPEEDFFSLAEALAEFHKIGELFPVAVPASGISPRVKLRHQQWQGWVEGKLAKLNDAFRTYPMQMESLPEYSGYHAADIPIIERELLTVAKELLRLALEHSGRLISLLSQATRIAVPHQPVLQSLTRRHLFFNEIRNHVNGIIDCCEVGIDSVAVDLGMMLAHILPWESETALMGLSCYQKIRPISDDEHYLMLALYHAETIMTPLDRLSTLFLPSDPHFVAKPNVAQVATTQKEIAAALAVIRIFEKNLN